MRMFSMALGAAVLVLPVAAKADEADIAKFQAFYDDYDRVALTRDRDAMLAFFAPDYLGTDMDGTSTAAEGIDRTLKFPQWFVLAPQHTTVVSATGDGQTETVEQNFHLLYDCKTKDGGQYKLEIKVRSHDVWVLSDGKWLVKSSRIDEDSMTQNDKLVRHELRLGI